MALTWRLWVDWDGDGTFEADEGENLFGMTLHRGRKNVVRSNGKGFEPPQVGAGTVMLLDEAGRYDPWNTDSPLYPNFTANKAFKIKVSDGVSTWPVAYGRIKRIKREAKGGYPQVRMDVEDGWGMLRAAVWKAMRRGIYAGEAMGLVLDEAGWPAGLRDLSDGVDEKAVWWASGETALAALHALAEAEYGELHMRGDGTVVFRDRHDMMSVAATVTAADIQRGIRIPLPWETVRTMVEVSAYLIEEVSGTLREFTTPTPIGGGSTEVFFWDVTGGIYVEDVSAVTWTATENQDGTGADRSGDVTVAVDVLAPTRVKVTATNSAGGTVWLQTVTMDGNGVQLSATTRQAENSAGAALYGERELAIDNRWLQDMYVAKDIADHLAWWYGDPAPERAMLELQLKDNPALQFGIDLGDVVHVELPEDGVSQDYILNYVEHHWRDRAGRAVETKWHLVPKFAFDDLYWFFPTRLGETSRFGF